jgi:transcription termination factor NusB
LTTLPKKNDKQKAVHYYNHALEIWKKLNDQNEIKSVQAVLDKL